MGFLSSALEIGSKYLDYRSAKKSQKLQKRAYTHGIRDRVTDAKAAGINPLAALGVSTNSPVMTTGSAASDGAGSVAREAAKQLRKGPQDKMLVAEHKARLLESSARSERDFALASKARSDIKRAGQNINSRQDLPQTEMMVNPSGSKFYTSPTTNAEEWEKQYSDLVGNIKGIERFVRDSVNQGKLNPAKKAKLAAHLKKLNARKRKLERQRKSKKSVGPVHPFDYRWIKRLLE